MSLPNGLQAVLEALEAKDYDKAKTLLEAIPAAKRNAGDPSEFNRTIAHAYASSGNTTLKGFETLKNAGVDLNIRDKLSSTPGHRYAASGKATADGFNELSTLGVDLKVTDNSGQTIAHDYAFSGNITADGLNALKALGVNLKATDASRYNIAHYYVTFGDATKDGLSALKEQEIDFNAKNNLGRTVAETYAASGYATRAGFEALSALGVNLKNGVRIAERYAFTGRATEDGFQALKELGIDFTIRDSNGRTIAHNYAASGSATADGFRKLKILGVDFTIIDSDGQTVAHKYADKGIGITADGFAALKEAGVDLAAKDGNKKTMLDSYKKNNKPPNPQTLELIKNAMKASTQPAAITPSNTHEKITIPAGMDIYDATHDTLIGLRYSDPQDMLKGKSYHCSGNVLAFSDKELTYTRRNGEEIDFNKEFKELEKISGSGKEYTAASRTFYAKLYEAYKNQKDPSDKKNYSDAMGVFSIAEHYKREPNYDPSKELTFTVPTEVEFKGLVDKTLAYTKKAYEDTLVKHKKSAVEKKEEKSTHEGLKIPCASKNIAAWQEALNDYAKLKGKEIITVDGVWGKDTDSLFKFAGGLVIDDPNERNPEDVTKKAEVSKRIKQSAEAVRKTLSIEEIELHPEHYVVKVPCTQDKSTTTKKGR